jgi:hypothetical protein
MVADDDATEAEELPPIESEVEAETNREGIGDLPLDDKPPVSGKQETTVPKAAGRGVRS